MSPKKRFINHIKKIKKRSGDIVSFDKKKIEGVIYKALTATDEGGKVLSRQLCSRVIKILNRRFKKDEIPDVEQIQDVIEEVLILENLIETSKAYILYREQRKKLRESRIATQEAISLVDEYLEEKDWEVKENSNMAFSLQGLNHYVSAYVAKKYWLRKIYPPEIREATEGGDFHIHDLDFLAAYCCGWDLYDLLLKGFGGVFGKIQSKPAKHFRSALGQIVNFFYTLQGEVAGAQAISNFDTLLAPFIRYDNLNYVEVRQCLQEFLFNCNVPTRVGFQCISEDTEILSPTGWKNYQEVEKGDIITTFNLKTKVLENKKVSHVFRRKYDGIMYRLRNRIQDQLISPKHRVVRRKFYSDEHVLEPIEEIMKLKSPFILPIVGKNIKEDIKLSDEQIKLMAWIISEGTIERRLKYRSCYRVSIYQSKIKNRKDYKEIVGLLKHFKFKYSEYKTTALGDEVSRLRLNAESSRVIHRWFGTKENIHFIPEVLLNFSKRQARLFLKTYLKGDGFEECKIAITELEILDGLQRMMVNAEYGSTVLKRKPTIGEKDIYVLRIIKHSETYIKKIEKVNYKGVIWSVHTQNETVIARRRGKIFITGNTPFENITLDLKVPHYFKDLPILIGGQSQKETYKDFQKEMDILNQALCEVYVDGDASGRVFTFPIPTYNITKDFAWSNPAYDGIWKMTAKYGIPYFCLDEDTELITLRGVKKIKDVSLSDYLLSEEGDFRRIKFKKKIRSQENIILEGEGFRVICSFNHRFPTKQGIKKAEELNLTDRLLKHEERVILENGMILNNYTKQFFKIDILKDLKNKKFLKLIPRQIVKKLPLFKYSKNRFQTTLNQDIRIPKNFNEDIMELIGIILGDGNLRKNGIRIVNADREILDFVRKIIEKEFKLTGRIRQAGHSSVCKEFSVYSVILSNFLDSFGLRGNTYSKRIPEICYWRSEKEMGALLRGLFDTDGSITLNRRKDHILSISLTNPELMNDVLVLLAKIGIVGKINKLGAKGSRLIITGAKNINLFKKKVGFRIKRKRNLLNLEPKDSLHPAIGDKILSFQEAVKIAKYHAYQNKKWFRVKTEEKNPYLFIDSYEKHTKEVLLTKIEKEYTSRVLYDITIASSSHLFVLKNRIISHNSNFINSEMKVEDSRSMCCRLRLDNRELYKRGGGLFGSAPSTGSIGVVTINMPRLAYLSKTKKEFFERLTHLMDLAKTSLEIKRKVLEDWTEKGLYPYAKYYLNGVKKIRGLYWGNHFSTIGLIGMNEALLNFLGINIANKKGVKFTGEVLDFMRNKLVEYQEETGNLYNLEATPAEGTSYRLALEDKKKYPDIITAGKEEPYYTNSTQLPVNYTDDLFEALKLQDELQIKYTGGTVFHSFLGEAVSDPSAVKSLLKIVFEKFHLPYFTLTPTFSICPIHGYIPGEHFICPKCTVEQPCEVYSRIVGYLRPVQQWHKGKQEEFGERSTFKI